MDKRKYEYAELLLKCVCAQDKKYLFIEMPEYLSDFKKILEEAAEKYDLKEVHFELFDPFKKHELLISLDQENIYKHPMFDKSIFNKYAKLDAAFLFISSMVPNLMEDVEPDIIKNTTLHTRRTQKYFRDLYETNKLNWCIAGVPNKYWAENGLNMSEEELWNLILDMCLVTGDGTSYEKWLEKVHLMEKRADILNKRQFKYLKYSNDLGTDLTIYLPDNHLWCTGFGAHGDLCNLPTEEIFTSPQYDKTEGIVYASKPLFYNNVLIDDFYLKFEQGKVVEYDAKSGRDLLKTIIETDDHSSYLGECALVSYDSPINNTGIIYKETLYDENAACHLALGKGFGECVEKSDNMRGDDLRALGVNDANIHVDFMIGDETLKVVGVDASGNETIIMENGNLVI